MRKKLLSLMTLLLCAVTGAWAYDDSYVADARHTAEVASESSYEGSVFSLAKSVAWTIAKDYSTATASDDAELTFDYGCLPSGTTGSSACYTLTALQDISSLKIYYTMSDSKFTTKDQSKSGNLMYQIGTDEAVTSSTTGNKSNNTAYVETISNISKDTEVKIYSSSNRLVIFAIYATASTKTVTSKVLTGININSSAWDISGLSENAATISTAYNSIPSVEFVYTINYSEGDPLTNQKETVTATKDGDNYVAASTVLTTNVTLTFTNVTPKAATPVITPTDGSYFIGTSQTITMTSATDGASIYYTTDGSTPTSSSSLYDGDSKPSITATTTIKAIAIKDGYTDSDVASATITKYTPSDITEVSTITTWDWTSWNQSLELTGSTMPTNTDDLTMSDIEALTTITIPSGFNGDAIKFKGQYPVRSKKSQAGYWTIKPSVSGIITVTFSDTGSSGDGVNRYLNINGTNTEYYTCRDGSSTDKKTVSVPVSAGNVVITAMKDDESTWQAIVVEKIVFTPTVAITPGKAKTTYVSTQALDFTDVDGLTAYVATGSTSSAVTLESVTTIPSGTPLVLKGTAGNTYNVPVAASASAPATNYLVAGTGAAVSAGADAAHTRYVLSGGVFKKITTTPATVPVGKAYLEIDESGLGGGSPQLDLNFDGENGDDITTGIDTIEHSTLNIEHSEVYNLNGQRVSQPTKGLYIVNGKKVIVK